MPSNLPPYDPSVCPDGSTRPDLCQPRGSAAAAAVAERGSGTNGSQGRGTAAAPPSPGAAPPAAGTVPGSDAEGGQPQSPPELGDALGLPDGVELPDLGQGQGPGGTGGGGGAAVESLLDFLFAP